MKGVCHPVSAYKDRSVTLSALHLAYWQGHRRLTVLSVHSCRLYRFYRAKYNYDSNYYDF